MTPTPDTLVPDVKTLVDTITTTEPYIELVKYPQYCVNTANCPYCGSTTSDSCRDSASKPCSYHHARLARAFTILAAEALVSARNAHTAAPTPLDPDLITPAFAERVRILTPLSPPAPPPPTPPKYVLWTTPTSVPLSYSGEQPSRDGYPGSCTQTHPPAPITNYGTLHCELSYSDSHLHGHVSHGTQFGVRYHWTIELT